MIDIKKCSFIRLFFPLLLFAILISCTKEPLQDQKIDFQRLDKAVAQLQEIANLKSIVVVQDNTVIREVYQNSGGAEIPHDVRSVTKSITGLLVGIAIDKGFINSVDQRIGDFIDPIIYTITPEKAEIKISNLLTMTGGFDWDELTSVSGYNNWVTSSNQVQYLLDKPLNYPAGQVFIYNSAALHLLSFILTEATGMQTLDFAKQFLFDPLAIGERTWETDHQGYNNGGAGLNISPYDMVKIGQLILNHGVFNGDTIISPAYIDNSIHSKISTNNTQPFGTDYGYCWWIGQNIKGSYVFANGYGGQFIVVLPGLDLVIVATNQWSGVVSGTANDQWYKTINIILTEVIMAFD